MINLKDILREKMDGEIFVSAVFSNKRKKSLEYSKVTIRPLIIGDALTYQLEYVYDKKVIHENLGFDDASNKAYSLVVEDFKQVNIFTLKEDVQILASKVEKPHVKTSPASKTCQT